MMIDGIVKFDTWNEVHLVSEKKLPEPDVV